MADHPVILALDTAMEGCSVAVLDSAGHATSESVPMSRGQSEQLVPMIDRVLHKTGVLYEDIDLVAVTVGPGAFTGLRIGLSAARALAVALDIPVTGVTTLSALAEGCFARHKGIIDRRLAVVLETKRADFYVQFYGAEGQPISVAEACGAETVLKKLEAEDRVIGDGAERLMSLAGGQWRARMLDGFTLPDPCMVARMALRQWEAKSFTPAEPLYLRDADVSMPKTPLRTVLEDQ